MKMSEKVAQALELIKGMSLLEASELKKALEEEFGVTAAAPVMMAGPAAAHQQHLLRNKQNLMLFFRPLVRRKLM
jgi:ribosomal protein L7/L12